MSNLNLDPLRTCRSALHFILGRLKKRTAAGMTPSCCNNWEWRWCDSWICQRKIQYLARRSHNCYDTGKSSLRDQKFTLIRLYECYIKLGSNMKYLQFNFFTVIKSRKSVLNIIGISSSTLPSLPSMNEAHHSVCWSLLEVISCTVLLNPCSNITGWGYWLLKPIQRHIIHDIW